MAGKIIKVSGPLVVGSGIPEIKMYDVVKVGKEKLIGEVIELHEDKFYVQVYESTTGLSVDDPIETTNEPLSVELGPGLLTTIYDGIQRPLEAIEKEVGYFIKRGVFAYPLDRNKVWNFIPTKKPKDKIKAGDILGYVQETPVIKHYILVPPYVEEAEIIEIKSGNFTIEDIICKIQTNQGKLELKMYHKWPVRKPRPCKEKLMPSEPLFTGQRVIDTFFPVGKGGTSCVPGPFGSGKTVIQHQLAKWADAEIIVYVGCGERGNEMTDVLIEFPELKDPKSGLPLMYRTVLIANTSNMPVAAREASIYTGITIAEYFRDMGYSVALMADSTSRWAEALREISGRLEEMPGEEGYPAYLPKKIAEFYERAGKVICLGSDERIGSLTVTGAVSPPGGDLSDPVVQATLKVVKVFWSLEDWLAYARHFPAINWLTSYSLYYDALEDYYKKNLAEDFVELRTQAMALLQKEAELKEIVRLVGYETLSEQDKLILEIARMLREDFLYQSAFDPIDTYCSAKKQYLMLKAIITLYRNLKNKIENQTATVEQLITPQLKEKITQLRFIPEEQIEQIKTLIEEFSK
ncbi:MAG: V-type ATP synthase subunit A [Elusimicrobiota bacterium]|nr:V-type ATP synthase subunit A [Endomicrobiia bacterium]MDW8165616.1 V-type ATP synthase subunit A [Elusimicrobiota bacterium]